MSASEITRYIPDATTQSQVIELFRASGPLQHLSLDQVGLVVASVGQRSHGGRPFTDLPYPDRFRVIAHFVNRMLNEQHANFSDDATLQAWLDKHVQAVTT